VSNDVSADRRPSRFLPGLGGLLRGELARWWWRRILAHTVAWTVLTTGLLWYATTSVSDLDWRSFDLLIHIWWIALPLGSIAISQNAMIEERQAGTLSWVASKPVSRPAVVLSKIVSDSVGIALPAVVLQAAIAWWMLAALDPKAGLPIRQPDAGRYLVVVGVEIVIIVLFVALSVCLGTIFRNRGPVAGIGLGVWILLWNSPTDIVDRMSIGGLVSGELSGAAFKPLTEYLVFGQPLDPASGVYWTLAWAAILTVLAMGVFSREQF
jgi:ABC-type transport system involved in multi-copper enzyme maturation permease subunit